MNKERERINKRRREKYVPKFKKIKSKCIFCQKIFVRKSKVHRYCSERCQRKGWFLEDPSRLERCALLFKKKRQQMKLKAIEYKGGKCEVCGYRKHPCALDFHHKGKKDSDMTKLIRSNNWKNIKKELKKCSLLCSNCHRELHFIKYE